MFIQYNISDGIIVNIQATNSEKVDDALLLTQGRAQYEVANDINLASKINILTGEIIAV